MFVNIYIYIFNGDYLKFDYYMFIMCDSLVYSNMDIYSFMHLSIYDKKE